MAHDYNVTLKVLMAPFLYITEEDRDKPFPNFYERWILGELRSYHKIEVIKIWEHDASDILRLQIIGFLPVVALMKHETEATERVNRDAIQQVQQKIARSASRSGWQRKKSVKLEH